MKEERSVRTGIDVAGGSVTVENPEEGDVVEVVDIESIEVSVGVSSEVDDHVKLKTVPDKKSSSDVADFYIEGDSDVIKQLYDVFSLAVKNINQQRDNEDYTGD